MRLRNKTFLTVALLMAGTTITFAASNAEIMNAVAFGAIIFTLILIVVACFVLLKTFKVLTAMLLPPEQESAKTTSVAAVHETEVTTARPQKLTMWQKLLSLRPMSEEKELLIMHDYDEIQELDNPIPAWFNWLFYSTVVFAFLYLLNYHVFNLGKLQEEEYVVEMKQASEAKEAYLAEMGDLIDENSVKIDKAVVILESGKVLFTQNCVACHGQNGEGSVGPNLTDEYWLHGGSIANVFKTIKYGVPEKGMIAWEKQLSAKQMSDVSNFIESLKGTNPANPKAPQGEKE